MSEDERFGELRSLMHALHGQDRWEATCAMLQDWPRDHLHDTVLPYLRGLFERDEATSRVAPDGWWAWGASGEVVSEHPALALATGIAWEVKDVAHAQAQLAGLRATHLTCHRLRWSAPMKRKPAYAPRSTLGTPLAMPSKPIWAMASGYMAKRLVLELQWRWKCLRA